MSTTVPDVVSVINVRWMDILHIMATHSAIKEGGLGEKWRKTCVECSHKRRGMEEIE